jgi:hypothetical protein
LILGGEIREAACLKSLSHLFCGWSIIKIHCSLPWTHGTINEISRSGTFFSLFLSICETRLLMEPTWRNFFHSFVSLFLYLRTFYHREPVEDPAFTSGWSRFLLLFPSASVSAFLLLASWNFQLNDPAGPSYDPAFFSFTGTYSLTVPVTCHNSYVCQYR